MCMHGNGKQGVNPNGVDSPTDDDYAQLILLDGVLM